MHVWLELITRELLFCALLAALGAGPATFLPERFDRAVRLTLAPALGLCIGACLTVTLVYAFPARDTGWLVVLLALGSLALAGWRTRGRWRRPHIVSAAQVAVVTVVVLASFNYPLASRHTVGPIGGYAIADTSGYVSETNAEQQESIHQADRGRAPFADLSLDLWSGYAQHTQQLDISALEANVNGLLGLGSTDTQSPFLIAVLLVGALGAFAAVRSASRRPTWAAVLAGCLFAGPLFAELLMDGSQAAIAGASLLAPIVVVGLEALRDRRVATLVLLSLLAAGLQTVYPLFVPGLVFGAVFALTAVTVQRLRTGRLGRGELGLAFGQLVGVIALSVLFTPVAFARNAHYWISILKGSFSFVGLPAYMLPVNLLPGWVLQTREFYGLVALERASTGQLLLGAALPLLLIAVIAFAVCRSRTALVMLAVAVGALLLAYYSSSSQDCSYCVQRNLVPVAALAPSAIGIGIAALAALHQRGGVVLTVAIAIVAVVAIGHEGLIERQRLTNGAYLLDLQDRQAAAHLPTEPGPVELEGFSEGGHPPMELPLVYNLTEEKTNGNASLPTLTDDGRGLAYLTGGPAPLGPSFREKYQYVLTRLAGIVTRRPIIARYGPIALERRTHDLDVTITGGVAVGPSWIDPTGTAWVAGPLQFLVVGGQPGRQAWVSLVLRRTVPVAFPKDRDVARVRRHGDLVRVCLRAMGSPPVRGASVRPEFVAQPPPAPAATYAGALPARGLRLVSMSVSASPCSGRP